MLANWITLSRVPLLLVNVVILYFGTPALRLAGVALLLVGMLLDTVDGIVARKRGETSLFGSVLDIAADRTWEVVLWVCFAHLGMIPLAIPLVVIGRTILTDAFRSIGVAYGSTPFALHRTGLGKFLVGSTPMRVGYSVTKTAAFCGLALAQALSVAPEGPVMAGLRVLAWVAAGFCVLRGLPVIVHTLKEQWGVRLPG